MVVPQPHMLESTSLFYQCPQHCGRPSQVSQPAHSNVLFFSCFQVATGAGKISHYFNLHVMVPAAFILGSGEYHIGEGSTISLVCIIENVGVR